jgi:zinc transport system permease protein
MHGVILGGALSLVFSLPLLPVSVAVNLLLVFVLLRVTPDPAQGFGVGSAVAMVFSMALASLIMHAGKVPANDTLSLLWGSPFALTNMDVISLAGMAVLLLAYVALNFKKILALFYNQEVALSLGVNARFHYAAIVTLIALTVALAMKILGALLIDSLLILPVLLSTRIAALTQAGKGIGALFVISAVVGLILSLAGFTLALCFDLPPSGAIAIIAGGLYCLLGFIPKERK